MIESGWKWLRQTRFRVLPAGSLRARLASGTFWATLGAVVSQGLGLVTSVIAARLLGKVGFGELGIINSTIAMLGIFAGLGLGTTATKYVSELKAKDPDQAGKIIGLSLAFSVFFGGLAAIVLFAGAPFLAAQVFKAPHLVNEVRISAALLFFSALSGAQTGALTGFEAFRRIAGINLVRGLLNLILVVSGIRFFGLPGGVGAMGLVAGLSCIIGQAALARECRHAAITIRYQGVGSNLNILWRFSLPAFLANIVLGPVAWVANTMLVGQPGGYAEMGVFNAANQWRVAITFLPAMIGTVSLPMLSSLFGARQRSLYLKVLWNNLLLTCGVALAVAGPVILAARPIMGLYGEGFGEHSLVLVFVAAACVLVAGNGVVGNAIISAGAVWWGFLFNLLWSFAFLAAAAFFIDYGALGLAGAYLLSYSLHSLWQTAYLYYLYRGGRAGGIDLAATAQNPQSPSPNEKLGRLDQGGQEAGPK